ncbi:response regulator transcription factor [Nocardiopsis sp. MG754419]|uniref:response regulator transcription factor n=1 Tax=Nocardiopsis sp. MG754419 TaxID=2259865 RepID=UPI001BAA925D|nr:response regulator transcription factor [Nocardiopsis sp. MG754419]MBR8740242.1 DNA-binding response regulator [Nocardiopsis sp. MG754419]
MIRILLAEDAHLVRGAIAALLDLEPDLEVVGQTGRGDAVADLVARHRPDVAVLDVEMPGTDGLSVAELLAETAPDCAVVVLTGFGRPGYLRRAVRAGVRGFLHKDAPVTELAQAVRVVHAGGQSIDPELATAAMTAGVSPLTRRETEVLRALSRGVGFTEVARALDIAEGTVRNHVSAAIAKTRAENHIGAVRVAQDMGWL